MYIKSPQNPPKSFAKWCQEKASLPVETQHTIDVLLGKFRTEDYHLAESKLMSLTELDLSANKIVDLRPLASLSNLKLLYLFYKRITDVTPLAGLVNLTHLELNINRIVDVTPLASLMNLTHLELSTNRIVDITPLASLRNLTSLRLRMNPIAVKVCPVEPKSICIF
jgi:internalin A